MTQKGKNNECGSKMYQSPYKGFNSRKANLEKGYHHEMYQSPYKGFNSIIH